jgi:hypothetical protein
MTVVVVVILPSSSARLAIDGVVVVVVVILPSSSARLVIDDVVVVVILPSSSARLAIDGGGCGCHSSLIFSTTGHR